MEIINSVTVLLSESEALQDEIQLTVWLFAVAITFIYVLSLNQAAYIFFLVCCFKEFVGVSKNDLIEGLKINHGIYVPLRNDTGYLILNYQAIKDNPNILKSVIKHELTHYFDKTQNKNNKWKDLVDLSKSPEDYTYKQKMAVFILSLLGYDMKDIQYLGSADKFEAFCTSIEEHKNEFNKDVLNNITEYVTTNKIKNEPKYLRNLYLFMFVNMVFDESRERIKYIEEHLK